MKKFFAVIGNPPYQEQVEGNGRANPLYPDFIDASQQVGERVELITPARFLFNAGQTKKSWNEKMLSDPHLKVLLYKPDGAEVFPNTDIKGGVAVTYWDETTKGEPIGLFIADDALRSINRKVSTSGQEPLSGIITGAVPYRFSAVLREERPELESLIGRSFDLRTNVLDKLDGKIFFDDAPDGEHEYVKVFGLHNGRRSSMYVDRRYIETPDNFGKYKLLLPKAIGSGEFGERFPELVVATPNMGHTQSFVSIGAFDSEQEAEALGNYLKSKFARALLGILKVTQDVTPRVFGRVPLQDFSSSSDIDWTQPIADIDRQLYAKYGLTADEASFIESHVKEMS